jgi:hypothetical protein
MRNVLLGQMLLMSAGLAGVGRAAAQTVVPPAITSASVEAPEAGGSQVRIVRLSQVRGAVQMDRNTGLGYEIAFANIPVVAGAKLRTAEGVAEIEFEDNSSLRLAPETEVAFVRLGRSATGVTQTAVEVKHGLVYVSLQKGKNGGEFGLSDGKANIMLTPGAHVRVDATHADVEVAVFDGMAALNFGSATTMLTKHETVTLNTSALTMTAVQKGVEEVDWDEWDKTQSSYHKNVNAVAGAGGFGLFGTNDLNYYGSFVDMPGCGSMWRPYFASAGWDPFANGVWTWYPGMGYSWVSPYPWGWLPFHSGSWASCGGAGWGWRPGGTWAGVQNHMLMEVAHHPAPHPLPPTPVKHGPTLVPVNAKPLSISGETGKGFMFRQDSAGLGVPREGFGRLQTLNAHVAQHGVVNGGYQMNGMTMMAPGGREAANLAGGTAGRGTLVAPHAGGGTWHGGGGTAGNGGGHVSSGTTATSGSFHGGSAGLSAGTSSVGGGAGAAGGGGHH